MPVFTLRSRWVLPVSSPPIENGRVTVRDGRIESVAKSRSPDPSDRDCGDAVLMPGLVNAHTHLELSGAAGQVGFDSSFVGWILQVSALYARAGPGGLEAGLRAGQRQSLEAGVTLVADIGGSPQGPRAWPEAPLHTVAFHEALGMGRRAVEPHARSLQAARDWCTQAPAARGPRILRAGIAPHAPYSTDADIYRQTAALAAGAGMLWTTHAAETQEEARFLADGGGPFRELLESLGLWDGSFRPPGCSPIAWLHRLGILGSNALLAHVNYAADEDLALLAAAGASVVFCPRAHRFFGHTGHRWREMLAAGVNVCLGTDSCAGGGTLSVLDEIRFLRAAYEDVPGRLLLRMGTMHGARALGLADACGALAPGMRADLIAVPLDDPRMPDPVEALLRGHQGPGGVWIAGGLTRPAVPS